MGVLPNRSSAPLPVISAGVAAVSHMVSTVAAGSLTPGYMSLQSAISDLGMTGKPHRLLVNFGALAVPGIMLVVTMLLAGRLFEPSQSGRTGLIFLAIAGGFFLTAGLVPFPSPVHLGSVLGAAMAAAVGIGAFSIWAASYLDGKGWLVTGFVCAALLVLNASFWVFQISDPRPRPHLYLGLQQRIASFSSLTWIAVCFVAVERKRRGIPRRAA